MQQTRPWSNQITSSGYCVVAHAKPLESIVDAQVLAGHHLLTARTNRWLAAEAAQGYGSSYPSRSSTVSSEAANPSGTPVA